MCGFPYSGLNYQIRSPRILFNGWSMCYPHVQGASCNEVNYKRERENLLGANLRKYLGVNQFGVRAAREKEKQRIIKYNERSNARNQRRPLLPCGRSLALAQLAPTTLAVGSAAPAATRDFVDARMRAYLPGCSSYAPALLCAAPAEEAESAAPTTCQTE